MAPWNWFWNNHHNAWWSHSTVNIRACICKVNYTSNKSYQFKFSWSVRILISVQWFKPKPYNSELLPVTLCFCKSLLPMPVAELSTVRKNCKSNEKKSEVSNTCICLVQYVSCSCDLTHLTFFLNNRVVGSTTEL